MSSAEPILLPEALEEALSRLPARDPGRPRELAAQVAAHAGPDLTPALLAALAETVDEAADPEMALAHLERWCRNLPTRETTLRSVAENPRLLADLLAITGASDFLAQILTREPWLYSMFLETDAPRTPEQYERAVQASLRSLHRPESRRDGLRRVKRREFLRIGWRDLARGAPMVEVAREISDLADAVVRGALQLAVDELAERFPTARGAVRFCVIAMGKLGARELNYSSDIDLMFVMDSPRPDEEGHREYARRVAERLIAILAEQTGEGRCFRVDMRLRPEGRTGALVRSYAAYREYYDRWAETWERQALIKARPVAGDAELGERYLALIRPVVYRRIQGATLLEDVREMRAAVERKLDAAGQMELHVKEGRGTIRDVEFTAQVLQLLFGADHPLVQARDTWTVLNRLAEVDLLSDEERDALKDGYVFFREVEHRLQLLHDLPVRLVPRDPWDLLRLARSLGFPDGDAFMQGYRIHSEAVRRTAGQIQARLGMRAAASADPLRETVLSADTPDGAESLRDLLGERGFADPQEASAALTRLAVGGPGGGLPSAARRLFADAAPVAVAAALDAADPAAALAGLADLADRKLLHRALYQTWTEHPDTLRALARFAGDAPGAMKLVLRYPELSDMVTDPEQWSLAHSAVELTADLRERVLRGGSYERRLSQLRRFKNRELIRLATRHVQRRGSGPGETAEWSAVADAAVTVALELSVQHLHAAGAWPAEDARGFAVFALGRYGGGDLHFPSDLDLLYVYGEAADLTHHHYDHLARSLGDALQMPRPEGRAFPIDLRLRPEGRQGASVFGLQAARRYYGESGRAEPWEFQALTRLRFIAGSAETAAAFRAIVEPRVYRRPMPAEWTESIRAMKRRMELERVPAAQRARHLKLGPGGFSDIEFLVQYLQLRDGGEDLALRMPELRSLLGALASRGSLSDEAVRTLSDTHTLLTDIRQSLYLRDPDGAADLLPEPETEAPRAAALARACGRRDYAALHEQYGRLTQATRALFGEVLD